MRTAIIIGALCLCSAINPEQVVPITPGIVLVIVVMSCMIMDVVDFVRSIR